MIGNAVRVMRIATGEETETLPADDGKDPAAKALGKKGGAARAKEHVAGKTCGDRKRGRGKTLGEKGVTHFTRHHIFCNLLSLTADGAIRGCRRNLKPFSGERFLSSTDREVVRVVSEGVGLADDVRRNTPWLMNLIGDDLRSTLRRAATM